ncbi:MAG: hypothetical protein NTV33_07905 [Coprothermobacterota bacterium]|nr:hypothetical protein [Coprothermobacterota bacterium]
MEQDMLGHPAGGWTPCRGLDTLPGAMKTPSSPYRLFTSGRLGIVRSSAYPRYRESSAVQ